MPVTKPLWALRAPIPRLHGRLLGAANSYSPRVVQLTLRYRY